MNTGPASEKTLRDEFAGQAMLAITISALSHNTKTGYSIGNPRFLECLSIDAYAHAEAMLAEKARREAFVQESSTTQPREVDDDHWAKFQDGIIITFEPGRGGWCASIKEGAVGSGNTVAEAIANLRDCWENWNVVKDPATHHSEDTLGKVDHSPDATKMIELQAANRELVEALEACDAAFSKFAPQEESAYGMAWGKVRAILAKHKESK